MTDKVLLVVGEGTVTINGGETDYEKANTEQ